jgi:hypothetical protein
MKILIPILLILSSCATQRSVERYIKKNGGTIHVDSTFVTDTLTFITNKVFTDSVFSTHTKDTVIIRKDNLTIKTFVYKDSIYVYGQCDTDTVTIIQERWVGNTLSIDENKNWFEKNWLILIMFTVLIVIVIFKR